MATQSQQSSDDQIGGHIENESLPAMLACSLEAFRRALPELLKTHYRQWLVYHGDQQLGFARTETELYKRCLQRGLKRDEFMVCLIEPELADADITFSSDW
jgi:hypothetical protein